MTKNVDDEHGDDSHDQGDYDDDYVDHPHR